MPSMFLQIVFGLHAWHCKLRYFFKKLIGYQARENKTGRE